jgi:hypothetical protein
MHDITKSSTYEQDIRLGARRVSEQSAHFCIGFCLENPYSSEERPTQVLAIVGQRDQRETKYVRKNEDRSLRPKSYSALCGNRGAGQFSVVPQFELRHYPILAFIVSIVFGEYYRGLGWVGVLIFVIGASMVALGIYLFKSLRH